MAPVAGSRFPESAHFSPAAGNFSVRTGRSVPTRPYTGADSEATRSFLNPAVPGHDRHECG
jgi:hypothetical protein